MHRMLFRFRELGVLNEHKYQSLLQATRNALHGEEKQESAAPVAAEPSLQPDLPVAATPSKAETEPSIPPSKVTTPTNTQVEPAVAGQDAKLPAPGAGEVAPIGTRVERYTASRQAALQEARSTPAPPPKPKRDWAHLFQAFLEKNNIMLGELVGGLLIVTCSIALVISFWAEIAGRPLLKFGIFNGVSAALFAAGFYTDRRWKIHTTSHGVLIIAILLVPLNFLAIAAFTASSPPTDLLSLAGEALSLAVFSALTYFAARTVSPHAPTWLTLCVMICSLMQLFIRRFAGPEISLGLAYVLAAVPLASFALAVVFSLRRSLQGDSKITGNGTPHFRLFGVCLFATLLPLALLLFKTGEVPAMLQQLAPLLVVLAGPVLATAIVFWQRLGDDLPALRVAAGSIGALGGVIFLASVGLASPLPFALVATALANCMVWIVLAWFAQLPRLNILAAAFIALAWLVAIAVFTEQASWYVADAEALANSVLSAVGGKRLLPVVALCCAIGAGYWMSGAKPTASAWGISAAAGTLASFSLLIFYGFGRVGDPRDTTWYFAAYAVLATTAAVVLNRRQVAWAAAATVVVAVVQTVVFRYGNGWNDTQAWILASLVYGTLAVALCGALLLWKYRQTEGFRSGFVPTGLASAVLAAALLVFLGWKLEYEPLAIGLTWLAFLWLALAWLLRESPFVVAFQVALAAAVGVLVTATLAEHSWFASGSMRWIDPWFWQAQGVALAASAIVWRALRITGRRLTQTKTIALDANLSRPPWSTFDRFAGGLLFVLVVLLAAYAVFPGMGQELSPSVDLGARVPAPLAMFELPDVSSVHAGDYGSWLLLAATVVLAGIGCWDRRPSLHVLALYLLGAVACLLGASHFADQTASASALRWLLGSYAVVAAIPIVARRQLQPRMAALGIELDPPPGFLGTSLAQAGRITVVALIVGLYLAIACFVAVVSIRNGPPTLGAERMLWWSAALAAVGGGIWLALSAQAKLRSSRSDVVNLAPPDFAKVGQNLIALSMVLPLLIVCAYVVASKLTLRPLVGPDPTSWFAGLGNSLLYGGPLALFAVVLLAFAIRETSSRYAFSFGLLVAGVATLVYLLELAAAGRSLDALAWIELAQLNATATAVVALGWCHAIAWRHRSDRDAAPRPQLLQVLAGLAVTFSAETLLAGCWGVFTNPTSLSWHASIADVRGLVSVTLATVALWLATKPPKVNFTSLHAVGLALLATTLLTSIAARFDNGNWQAYHTMLVVSAAASWALVSIPAKWSSPLWATAFAGVTAVVALRELAPGAVSPHWPWWSIGGLLAVYGALLRIALVRAARWPVWLGAPMLAIAAHAWWWNLIPQRGAYEVVNFFDLNAIALAIASIGSVLVELRTSSRATSEPLRRLWLIGFHRFAVWLAIGCLLLEAATELVVVGGASGWATYWWLGLVAIAVTASAIVVTLWDPHVRWPVVACYSLSLAAVGKFLGMLSLEDKDFMWAFTLALAAFVLATSYLWQRREAIAASAVRLGAPAHLRERLDSQVWILAANGLAILVVLTLVTQIELTHSLFSQRMTAAYAVLACGFGLAFMAAGRVESALRYLAIATGALFAVAFAWAWIPPDLQVAGLHRLVAAGVALAALIPIYGTLLVKIWRRNNPWVHAAQKSIPVLVAIAGVLLAMTLATEASYFVNGQDVPLVWPAIFAVALAVTFLAASSLAAALLPGRDPLNLSERGRTVYVYATEAFLGLLFLHIRVTMPWLFSGWFAQYWPFIVMLIAFIGVGLSEWFARRQNNVLAEPLSNTGIFLPLLPVIGFWSSAQASQYALLLIAVGALYSTMSVMRKTPLLMGVALLAFNGSLWTLLHSVEGFGLLRHPQFWLIPPVLCVLVGTELNRSRMSTATLRTVRYACAVMIYAASTADIFINGVGTGMWLPLVLAALSLAGVFAGILLRIRAFLFLGIAFLCVSLFSVVWHAAVELERTWIWWVAGIVTGVAIIVLFGIFEKKREQALVLVEQIKHWDP